MPLNCPEPTVKVESEVALLLPMISVPPVSAISANLLIEPAQVQGGGVVSCAHLQGETRRQSIVGAEPQGAAGEGREDPCIPGGIDSPSAGVGLVHDIIRQIDGSVEDSGAAGTAQGDAPG